MIYGMRLERLNLVILFFLHPSPSILYPFGNIGIFGFWIIDFFFEFLSVLVFFGILLLPDSSSLLCI